MHSKEEKIEAFSRLLDVVDELREKCPWDRKQTNESLRENTIEETYELCDALLRGDELNICKELGDVLLHVCFYSRIGSEKGAFDIADVCTALTNKLIYRHPHVYGSEVAEDVGKVLANWEQLKLNEKDGNKRVLSGVPVSLPSVIKAFRMQEKAANVGFDWEQASDVWNKVREELGELEEVLNTEDRARREEEFGDLLFAIINAARLYKIHPDNALEKTCEKFRHRFNYIEDHSIAEGKNLREMTLSEMDELWNEAKAQEHNDHE